MSRTTALAWGAVVAAVLASPARLPSQSMSVAGTTALANRWYTQGGCGSRSGATATPPLLRQPVRSWQFEAKGSIVGEPLVWDDLVLLELHFAGERRQLQVLALADGAPVASKEFTAAQPLAPSLWHRDVVVRTGKQVKRYLFGKGGFSEQRVGRVVGQFGPPVRLGEELYVIRDGGVERWHAVDLAPVWRCGAGHVGQVAVHGAAVYAAQRTEAGMAVVEIDRDTGAARAATVVPLAVEAAVAADVELAVGGARLVLRFGAPVRLSGGVDCNAMIVPLPLPPPQDVAKVAFVQMHAAPVLTEALSVLGWGVAPGLELALYRMDQPGKLLADVRTHAAFLKAPATAAGAMLYLGGAGVDAESLQIRWRLEVPAGARAVVARDTLLFGADRRLVAFVDAAAKTVATAPAATDWDELLAQHRRALLQGVAADALQGLELAFLDTLLARCRREGVDEKWVAEQTRLRTAKSRLAVKADPARLAALQARAAAIEREALAAVFAELPARAPATEPVAHRAALRFLLGEDRKHAGAAAAVAALLPEPLRAAEPFDAREWLDFADATAQVGGIGFVAADERDLAALTADQLKLLELRARWRKDLIALQSRRLIVYTPVTAPGSIARCLSLGELVCDGLEAMFAGFPVLRQDPRRMRLCLFPSQAEYKKHSPGGGHLAWTAGHYSPQEELSRMFLPKDAEAFARVMPVFVHEITHQWLEDRCPALHGTLLAKRRPDQPGHWIVEGFASFVEQFTFDLGMRTQATDNPCDEHLDLIAHATAAQLLPWAAVLRASAVDFSKIPPVPDESRRVSLGHRLGSYQVLSQRNCFYAQAGALCHWLWHAEGGKHRPALLAFVLAYYGGDAAQLDLGKTLGMTPAAIGEAVVAHAKARVR